MKFVCKHCGEPMKSSFSFDGGNPTGMLQLCDCDGARKAWEAEHRATIEARKNARRASVQKQRGRR